MKSPDNKRRLRLDSIYCARCYVRVGIGERHRVKDGKPYHYECYDKVKDSQFSSRAQQA